MQDFLSFSLIFLVVIIVAIQIYFRIRLAKNFNLLKKHKIDLSLPQLFNESYFNGKIIKGHPKIANELTEIRNRIKNSFIISIACLLLIAFLATYIYLSYKS